MAAWLCPDGARCGIATSCGQAEAAPLATHGEDVVVALRFCWIVLGAAADKWMAPFLSELVAKLRICGELKISDEMAALLSAMSAATIDRKLDPERAKLDPRGRSHTKPGSLLKYQISINKFEVSVRLPRYLLGSQRFFPARLPGPRGRQSGQSSRSAMRVKRRVNSRASVEESIAIASASTSSTRGRILRTSEWPRLER